MFIHSGSGNVCVIAKGKIRIENVEEYAVEKTIYESTRVEITT